MTTEAASRRRQPDFNRLRLVRGDPGKFARRLPEIRDLRKAHYLHNEPFDPRRAEGEKLAFAGLMNVLTWMDPSKGQRVNPAQRHRFHQVVAAIDRDTDTIEGYAYLTINDASRVERKMRKFAPLKPVAVVVGALERAIKRHRHPGKHEYAYIREIVRNPNQPDTLENVLGAAALVGYENDPRVHTKKGTIYPKSEQTALLDTLSTWGYQSDGGEPQPGYYFGEDAPEAEQERWLTQDIGVTADSMLHTAGVQALPPVEELTLAL